MKFEKINDKETKVLLDNGYTIKTYLIEYPVPMPNHRRPVYELSILNEKGEHVISQYSEHIYGEPHFDTYFTSCTDEDIAKAMVWAGSKQTIYAY